MAYETGAAYLKSLQNRARQVEESDRIERAVQGIIREVRLNGDQALYTYTEQFDGVQLENLVVTEAEFEAAEETVGEAFMKSIRQAKTEITAFHEAQKEQTWLLERGVGKLVGQKVTALQSVGIYVPGGKAAYPSTVLMNAIPAKIAGVKRIQMTTPVQKDGTVNPYVLAAAKLVGVDVIYKVGGAQAVAALAYGTETVQKVVKIVGPGNAYVAEAKKQVFGQVAIDMIAGPSEVCVVADDSVNPKFVAADLLAQAEHDEMARAICITTSASFADELRVELEQQTARAERRAVIEKSLAQNGKIVLANDLQEAFTIVNELAPEHLQLMIDNPMDALTKVENAGAIFLGSYSPEALGDYMAGPNHTLPTSGTAKFSSPLGVYDFMKKSSIIQYSKEALQQVADDIIEIATKEQLPAHAASIAIRKDEVE